MLWEAAQYSFLGDYTNSFGLTFAKTRDPGCDYWYVIIVWVVEWAAFLALAWYIDQVGWEWGCMGHWEWEWMVAIRTSVTSWYIHRQSIIGMHVWHR